MTTNTYYRIVKEQSDHNFAISYNNINYANEPKNIVNSVGLSENTVIYFSFHKIGSTDWTTKEELQLSVTNNSNQQFPYYVNLDYYTNGQHKLYGTLCTNPQTVNVVHDAKNESSFIM